MYFTTLRSRKSPRSRPGFTIIEVLIVMAIAGLILSLVFLAIPALRRAQRNTQRKHDAGLLVAAIQEEENNNYGKLPAPSAVGSSHLNANIHCSDSEPACGFVRNAGMSYYSVSDIGYVYVATSLGPLGGATFVNGDTESAGVMMSAKCDADGLQAVPISPIEPKRAVVLYSLEDSHGNPVDHCMQAS